MTKDTVHPGVVEFMAPFLKYFHRHEGRELPQIYMVGVRMDGERQSVEPMPARINASERGMQATVDTGKVGRR